MTGPGGKKTAGLDWAMDQMSSVWEYGWSRKDYDPFWRVDGVPDALNLAVRDGFFVPGGPLLDIGCGGGELAAWLVEQGFAVKGIDVAPSAIDTARKNFPEIEGRLSYEVVDICRDTADRPIYHSLFDRGCLHGMPVNFYECYARTLRTYAAPGARLLIISSTNQGKPETPARERELKERRVNNIRTAFAPYFEWLDIADCIVIRQRPHHDLPAIAIRMQAPA